MIRARIFTENGEETIGWNEVRYRLLVIAQDIIEDAYGYADYPKKHIEVYLPSLDRFAHNIELTSADLTPEERDWLNDLKSLCGEMNDPKWEGCVDLPNPEKDRFIATRIMKYAAGFSRLVEDYLRSVGKSAGYRDPLDYLAMISSETYRIVYVDKDGRKVKIKIPSDLNIVED